MEIIIKSPFSWLFRWTSHESWPQVPPRRAPRAPRGSHGLPGPRGPPGPRAPPRRIRARTSPSRTRQFGGDWTDWSVKNGISPGNGGLNGGLWDLTWFNYEEMVAWCDFRKNNGEEWWFHREIWGFYQSFMVEWGIEWVMRGYTSINMIFGCVWNWCAAPNRHLADWRCDYWLVFTNKNGGFWVGFPSFCIILAWTNWWKWQIPMTVG